MKSPEWPLVVSGMVFVGIGATIGLFAPAQPPRVASRLFVWQSYFMGGRGAKMLALAWGIPGAVIAIAGLIL
jgi:hypothetical protein